MKLNRAEFLRGCLGGMAWLAAGCQTPQNPNDQRALFNGENLEGWRSPHGEWFTAGFASPHEGNPRLLEIYSGRGLLVNGHRGNTVNLLNEWEHGDCEVQIEFMVPRGSNSGIYFQGRYEIQVYDSWGVEVPKHSDCGGIYERWENDRGFEGRPPLVNASRPPGEWQTFDIVFRAPRFQSGQKVQNARFVRVHHNGVLIHSQVDVTGPTRSAAFDDEQPRGPLMLQGDHGPVVYRKIVLRDIRHA